MSRQIIAPAEYREIFLSDRPLVDLRAPVEFAKGAFPASTNLPLMNDSERQKVGTCYKEHGQAAAIELGHSLVKGKIKAARIQAWLDFFSAHPDANLYCFRGGLRSQLTQQWIREAGLEVPYIQGGYKAMRQYLIDTIDNTPQQQQLLILSGITGSGKTEFILSRSESVDLEALPITEVELWQECHAAASQINFENSLARELLRHQERQESCLLLEDESFLIGRRAIPKVFFSAMQQAQVLVLEEPLEARLPRLLDEYVHKMQRGFEQHYGTEEGMAVFGAICVRVSRAYVSALGTSKLINCCSWSTQACRPSCSATLQSNIWSGSHCCWRSITTPCISTSWRKRPSGSSSAVTARPFISGWMRGGQTAPNEFKSKRDSIRRARQLPGSVRYLLPSSTAIPLSCRVWPADRLPAAAVSDGSPPRRVPEMRY